MKKKKAKKNKIGLIFGGGGAKGAFSVGICKAVEEYGIENVSVITGTSVGALVGALLASNKVKELEYIWKSIKDHTSIFKKWSILNIGKIFKHRAIYDNSPLVKLINTYLDDTLINSPIKFGCPATNLNTGYIDSFNNREHATIMEDAIIASSALPLIFPKKNINGVNYVDGGLREGVPVKLAVELDNTCDIYYIVLPDIGYGGIETIDSKKISIIDELSRIFDILFSEIYKSDIELGIVKHGWDSTNRFKIIQPKIKIIEGTLDFNPERISLAIEDGYKIGKEILNS